MHDLSPCRPPQGSQSPLLPELLVKGAPGRGTLFLRTPATRRASYLGANRAAASPDARKPPFPRYRLPSCRNPRWRQRRSLRNCPWAGPEARRGRGAVPGRGRCQRPSSAWPPRPGGSSAVQSEFSFPLGGRRRRSLETS